MQFYGSKNAYDPMEYTLIMNVLVCLSQTQQWDSAVTARDIAKNRSLAKPYIHFIEVEDSVCSHTIILVGTLLELVTVDIHYILVLR